MHILKNFIILQLFCSGFALAQSEAQKFPCSGEIQISTSSKTMLSVKDLTCSWVYYSCEGKGDVQTGPKSYDNNAVTTALEFKRVIIGSRIQSERDGSSIAPTSGIVFLGEIPSDGHNRTVEIGNGCKNNKIDVVAMTSSAHTLSYIQISQGGGKKNLSEK